MKLLFVGLGMFAITATSQAQDEKSDLLGTFTIGAQIRPRMEMMHGYKTLADSAQKTGLAISQRSRINVGFTSKWVHAKIVLQDVRVWGSQPQLVANDGLTTTIHEAWGRVFFHKNFSMKIGRQEIIYDDHRIFGSVGWAQQARSHDALILMYEDEKMKIHGGFAYNQNGISMNSTIYNLNKSYKAFMYLWAHRNFGPVQASLLYLANGKQVRDGGAIWTDSDGFGRTNFTHTIGFRASLNKKDLPLKANVAFYYQLGTQADTLNHWSHGTASGTQVGAYYIGADVNYTIAKKITIGLGMEMLSGNSTYNDPSNPNTDPTARNAAFNPFYGTNHKFNGWMDYFYVGNHIGNVGLTDIFLQFKAKLPKKSFIGFHAHAFLANGKMADPNSTNELSSFLGTELDFFGGVTITPWANIKLGYSQMIGTESMAILKNNTLSTTEAKRVSSAPSMWGWVMVTVNPSHTFKLKKPKKK